MQLLPTPKSDEKREGSFTLTSDLYFIIKKGYQNRDFLRLAKELTESFCAGFVRLSIIEAELTDGKAYISRTVELPSSFCPCDCSEYEYVLDVSQDLIEISYNTDVGLIHAFSSFLILAEMNSNGIYSVSCRRILDKPSLSFRAAHICVFPETTLDFLKKCVRFCGIMKYTHICIEFWGTYRYRFTDLLSWDEHSYTESELRPIINDIRAFGAEPVPMFNFFGHASQSRVCGGKHVVLDRYPEKEYMFESDGWAWKVDDPEVFDFLEKAVSELCELFGEGKYFHFGCDEVYSITQRENPTEYLASHFNRIEEFASSIGRRGLIWGDMLIDGEMVKNEATHICMFTEYDTHKAIEKTSKKLVIVDWQYYMKNGVSKTGEYFKENGFDTILCPWISYPNISFLCKEAKRMGLMGVMLSTWHTVMERFDALAFAGEEMWGSPDNGEYKPFRSCTGALVRKLVPSGGDYKKSGWQENQLTYNRS